MDGIILTRDEFEAISLEVVNSLLAEGLSEQTYWRVMAAYELLGRKLFGERSPVIQ